MSTQETDLNSATANPTTQLVTPAVNKQSAALNSLIDSVLHKLSCHQSDSSLGCLCIGVVGSGKRVGVSTVTHRLAIQSALNNDNAVLVVDANGAQPQQHRLSGVSESPGLVEYLTNRIELKDCIQETSIRHMDLLTWGTGDLSGSLVSPIKLKELFADLRSRYQVIFVDLPAIEELTVGTVIPYAMMCDGVVLVLDGTAAKQGPTKELVDLFQERGIKVLGAIMNRYKPVLPRWLQRWF
ncbi:MAG: CpsD/CapB family tyrosine-protein kinase [Pirellulales bacterium]